MKINKALNLAKKYAEKHGYSPENFEEEGVIQYSWIGLRYHDREPENCIKWLKEKYGADPMIFKGVKIDKNELIFRTTTPIGAVILEYDFYYYGYLDFYYKELIEKHKWNINGYNSIKKGIIINTKTTETFLLAFYKFHDYFICDEFCKTQPFSDDEYLTNIKHHINFCNMLEIVEQYMDHSYINDEGDYYETHDVKKLSENFGANARLIWSMVSALADISNESFGFTIGGKINVKKFKKYKKEP
ncbi:MAG: hypothetical protein QW272_09760 [Candidatus Methanomethylicaceae archaeon]